MVDVVKVRHLASQLVRHLAQLVTRAARTNSFILNKQDCKRV